MGMLQLLLPIFFMNPSAKDGGNPIDHSPQEHLSRGLWISPPTLEMVQHYVDMCFKSSKHLLTLINDIMDYSKVCRDHIFRV
jgi:hypothetical protein